MSKMLIYLEKHQKVEHAMACILALYFILGGMINIMFAIEIISSNDTVEFLNLLDSFLFPLTWFGRAISSFMQFYYADLTIFVFSLFNTISYFDLFFITLLCIYLAVLPLNSSLMKKQRSFVTVVSFHVWSYAVILMFIILALNSLSTAQAFNHLKFGAVGLMIFNVGKIILSYKIILTK